MQNNYDAAAQAGGLRLLSEGEIHAVTGARGGVEGDVAAIAVALFFAYATGALGELWDWLFG
jgi:hypothetical protein